jgi:HK97 family phage major capsid protein
VPRRVLDLLVNRTSLGTNTFEYLRQTARVNNATAVPDGALKPTSTFTVNAVEDRCRVLAHLSEVFPVRFLADYDSLVAFLDTEMVEGVEQALETQALVGDGTGETLTGVLATSGTVAVPYSTSLFATIRKARTQMELLGVVPTGWVMHPTDLETVDLQTDTNGRLYLVGAGGDDRINALFGDLPRVASSRIPQGTAILADWGQCRLYIREEVRLDMDRSGVLFDHNQVKLRAEARIGFAVLRAQAFATVDLAA